MGGSRGKSLELDGKGVYSQSHVNSNESGPGKHADTSMLELGLAEVIHGNVVRNTKGVESYISNVSLKVFRVRQEGKSLRLLGAKGSGLNCRE